MKLTCIIVDDEPIARKVLQEYIEDIDFLELVGSAENPLKAGNILSERHVDVMFLDINMPKINGIEFLRTTARLPLVVLTTAYAEYATLGFELDVMDYLVKPFSFERFLKACNKIRDYCALKNNKAENNNAGNIAETATHFFVKCDGKIEKVLYSEVLYIEAMLNYIVLHTEARKMVVYLTIKSIIDQLPADVFIKVHKSYIININKIKSIEGNEISLGNAKVTISQNFYDGVIKEVVKDRMIRRI